MTPKSKTGFFFGWWVIAGCSLSYSMGSSIYWVTTMIFPQLEKEMGWTAADLGLLLATASWARILWSSLGGWICDRIGNRWTILIFTTLGGIAVLLYTGVSHIWQMYILFPIFCCFGTQTALNIGALSLPRKWFIKHAALAYGVIGGFWGLFSSIVFPVVTALAVSSGWRQAIFMVVPLLITIGILASIFLIRNTPEEMGLNVDGASHNRERNFPSEVRVIPEETSIKPSQAMRTPQFWLLSIIFGTVGAFLGAIQGNITLIAVGYGITPAAAGTAMSALMIPAIFSRTGVGLLGDRWGTKRTLMICTGISTLIFLGGWLLINNTLSLYVFLVLQGFFMMAGMTLCPPLWGDLFGRKHLSSIMGYSGAVSIIVSGLTSLAVGFIREATGAYNLVFLMLGGLGAVQIISLLLLRPLPSNNGDMGASSKTI